MKQEKEKLKAAYNRFLTMKDRLVLIRETEDLISTDIEFIEEILKPFEEE